MAVDPQHDVIEFLGSPSAHGGVAVERIETHSAIVFLAGRRALKLKRAVRFDYLDFSTPALRHAACDAEVRINCRTAPAIYRGVVAVTREPDGRIALDGSGVALDWCVDMVRFDQEALLDRVAARGALDFGVVERLAASVALFHMAAERRTDHGGTNGMRWVIEGNAAGFADYGRTMLPAPSCAALTTAAQRELARQDALLEARRKAGFVRQCHGDLHLRNIVLLEGTPTPFDAIEFNDEIACVDVLYDLAFLLMDLWRRGLRRHANLLLSGYLSRTQDFAGLALLPLFLSCRAAVRAKTSATSATLQTDAERRRQLEALAREYLAMAAAFVRPVPATLVAIGGRSGTGKSTLAQALAPEIGYVPGAVVLRSDEIRKAQFGVSPLERLGSSGYAAEASDLVYRTLEDRARASLQAGHSVVADAAFLRECDRTAIEAAAADARGGFVGLWLDAPLPVLTARVDRRSADVSDADTRVVQAQMKADVGQIGWDRVDAARDYRAVLAEAHRRLGIGAGNISQELGTIPHDGATRLVAGADRDAPPARTAVVAELHMERTSVAPRSATRTPKKDAMKIESIMTGTVQSCGPGTNLASIVDTMWTHDCGIVPVVNERGEAVGVVTDRDICIALGTRNVVAAALTARDVMTHPVVGCAPEDDCFSALLTMEQHRVHRLPVLGTGGILLGIVSIDDIVERAARAPAGDPLRMGVMEVLAAVGGHKTPAKAAVVGA